MEIATLLERNLITDAAASDFECIASLVNPDADYSAQVAKIVTEAVRVVLRFKGRDIIIDELRLSEGRLIGRVAEFSQVCAISYEGIRLGQQLCFDYYHIHETIR